MSSSVHRLPSSAVSAGARLEALAAQAAAQANDETLSVSQRLHFLSVRDRLETEAALADADALLADAEVA